MDNSIPICRSILTHWVYEDAEYLKVWLTMLSQARYKEEPKTVMYEKALCTLNYGEFIFGYKAWSSKTGISYQRLRTLMSRLIEDNMLVLQLTTYHYSVYAVVNYAKFNSQETLIPSRLEGSSNSHPTGNKQPSNNHPTTNEEGTKKEKKVKKDLDIYIDQFEEFWKLYPRKTAKTAALKCWKTLISDKTNPNDLITASKNYSIVKSGKEEQFILQASTFLGPQKRYEDFLKGGAASGKSNDINQGDLKPWETDPYCIGLNQT